MMETMPATPEQNRAPWTPEADDELRRLYMDGRTNPEIAIAIGRTRAAVARRLTNLRARGELRERPDQDRVYRGGIPKDMMPEITRRVREGQSYGVVAHALGLDENLLGRFCRRWGIRQPGSVVNETRRRQAKCPPRRCLGCRQVFTPIGGDWRLCETCRQQASWVVW